MEPNAPIGTANSTEKGIDQLSYNAARNKNTKTMEIANMIACWFPAAISSRVIPENS